MVKKGSAKGSKSTWEPARISEDAVVQRNPEAYLVVHVRGVTWQFLDFTQRMLSTEIVASVERLITARHGASILGLTLYKDEVHPRNLLGDPRQTLDGVGFASTGAPTAGVEAEVVIYYDFEPHSSDCPLLLCAPRDFRIEAKEQERAAASKGRSART